jgi:histidinol dehydrogenase
MLNPGSPRLVTVFETLHSKRTISEPVASPGKGMRRVCDESVSNLACKFILRPYKVETMPGVRCRRVSRPIGAVGLYVPGGRAAFTRLTSSLLLLLLSIVLRVKPPHTTWRA